MSDGTAATDSPEAGPAGGPSSRLGRAATAAAVVAGLLAVWQAVVWLSDVPPFILPGPGRVGATLWTSAPLLAEHALVTASEVALGLVIGVALGVETALLLMVSRVARRVFHPVMVFSQAVPVFALAPLLTLWFGFGLLPKVMMATLIIYFPVASNFYDGLRRTDRGLLDLARTMGGSQARVLFQLRVPSALPALGSGLRLAAVYAPIGAVISEWVGASSGLGYLMIYANARTKIDLMFAALLVLALMTVALHQAVSWLARRLTAWAPESVGG